MPQSLGKMYVHLIFSTKKREPRVERHLQPELHAYMGGILVQMGCLPVEINTEPDHAHLLFVLSRTAALSDIVSHVKSGWTHWLRERLPATRPFHWQNGYGAFSVSQSGVKRVREYIRSQEAHHRTLSFQDEFRRLVEKYEIDYDERYVWD
jgi:REP element-mobilizing transposase RayT